jgi:hypothetical protein
MAEAMNMSLAALSSEIGTLLDAFGDVRFEAGTEAVPRPREIDVLIKKASDEEKSRRGEYVAICTQYSSGVGYGASLEDAVSASLQALRTYLLRCKEHEVEPIALADDMSIVQFQSGEKVELKAFGIKAKAAQSAGFVFQFKRAA